jgi:hypothetical protein
MTKVHPHPDYAFKWSNHAGKQGTKAVEEKEAVGGEAHGVDFPIN